MSRQRENARLLEKIVNNTDPKRVKSHEDLNSLALCDMASILSDISVSLAIIADKLPMNPDEKLLLSLKNESEAGHADNS